MLQNGLQRRLRLCVYQQEGFKFIMSSSYVASGGGAIGRWGLRLKTLGELVGSRIGTEVF